MDLPDVIEAALDGESVAARVSLRGEDELFVTATRTLVYRADGLLSDESVTTYPHGAERVEVSSGRRKATVTLDYGLDGEESLSVPPDRVDDVLHPVLAGVLNASGVTRPGETVKRTYRFSELTLVVTSDQVVKHVGSAVWSPEFESIPFAEVRGLGVEEGSVSSQIVLETPTRTERIKAPNEGFRDVRNTVEDAVFAYYDVDSLEAFEAAVGGEDEEEESGPDVTFQDAGLDPIDTSGVQEAPDGADAGGSGDADWTPDDADDASATAGGDAQSTVEATPRTASGDPVEADRSATRADAATGDASAQAGGDADADTAFRDGPDKVGDVAPSGERGPGDADGGNAGTGAGGTDDGTGAGGADATADADPAILDELEALRADVERQREALDEQAARIDALLDRARDR